MKFITRLGLFVFLTPLFGAESPNIIVNGDFQTGWGDSFHATPGWFNQGVNHNQEGKARAASPEAGSSAYAATINDRYDAATGKFGRTAHTQKTDHIIQAGDAFILTYEWRPFDENWQNRRDTVRFVVFATSDDTLQGSMVWSVSLTSDFYAGYNNAWKSVTHEISAVASAAVGKKLWVCFHGMDTEDGVSGTTHYARVDNIVLTQVGQGR